jgi:hypothetical protein
MQRDNSDRLSAMCRSKMHKSWKRTAIKTATSRSGGLEFAWTCLIDWQFAASQWLFDGCFICKPLLLLCL